MLHNEDTTEAAEVEQEAADNTDEEQDDYIHIEWAGYI